MAIEKMIKCESCGADDMWEGYEDVVRLTGRQGDKPEMITVAGCACGYQQTIVLPE